VYRIALAEGWGKEVWAQIILPFFDGWPKKTQKAPPVIIIKALRLFGAIC
jgi:hypothetical protein